MTSRGEVYVWQSLPAGAVVGKAGAGEVVYIAAGAEHAGCPKCGRSYSERILCDAFSDRLTARVGSGSVYEHGDRRCFVMDDRRKHPRPT